jgi:hypothetical protein
MTGQPPNMKPPWTVLPSSAFKPVSCIHSPWRWPCKNCPSHTEDSLQSVTALAQCTRVDRVTSLLKRWLNWSYRRGLCGGFLMDLMTHWPIRSQCAQRGSVCLFWSPWWTVCSGVGCVVCVTISCTASLSLNLILTRSQDFPNHKLTEFGSMYVHMLCHQSVGHSFSVTAELYILSNVGSPHLLRLFFLPWYNSPQWAKTSSSRVHDRTQTQHTR